MSERITIHTVPIALVEAGERVMEKVSREQEERQKFREFLDWASKVVAMWPEWKRNVLSMSGKAMNDTPRRPVANKEGE